MRVPPPDSRLATSIRTVVAGTGLHYHAAWGPVPRVVSPGGAQGRAFVLSGFTGPAMLSPGSSTTFEITYSGSACVDVAQPHLDANVVHILSNDPGQADYVIELAGTAD